MTVIDRACDPWPLLDRAERVYSVGGEIGFLALLAGIPVTAFAAAPYTGWGVTEDRAAVPRHGFRRSVDEIFAGICLVATRCRDPFRNAATPFEEALAIVADWRRIETANRRIAVCVGMSFWKRRRIADFVRSTAGVPVFRRTRREAHWRRPAPIAAQKMARSLAGRRACRRASRRRRPAPASR